MVTQIPTGRQHAHPRVSDAYVAGPVVDHHCHGLLLDDLDRAGFEALMNEGAGGQAWTGSPFDSMLGLAVRRHCAPLLDLAPHADPDTYLARRAELGGEEVARRMLATADVGTMLVDTGYLPEDLCSPDELAALAGESASAREVVRLETTAQDLLASGTPATDLLDAVGRRLRESGAVAAKSIAAYRCGLDLPGERPGRDDVAAALRGLRPDGTGAYRITDRLVVGALAWTAIDAGLPLQLHVGYGDKDVDLLRCDPLHLTSFLRSTEASGVPVLLLHTYPFHRNAAYLAQVFDHVFVDVGLTVHNVGAFAGRVLGEVLELAPFGKLLHSSDACGLAELFLLGTHLFRTGLHDVLAGLVARGELSDADAHGIGARVAGDNARRAYGLS